jgi:hypothetical protein
MRGADIVGRPREGALLLIAGGSRLGVGWRRAVDTGPMARSRRHGRERWSGWDLAAGTGKAGFILRRAIKGRCPMFDRRHPGLQMIMFLRNAEPWKEKLRREIGFSGRHRTFTDLDCMQCAMDKFIHYYHFYLGFGLYWYLVPLYRSVLAVEHDQRINEYGRAVMKRFKFLLKHSHCKHYGDVHFPDQAEYILQRKAVLAMSLHPRLGRDSPFSLLDPHLTKMIVDFALNDDPFLGREENYKSLNNRFAALYAADWDD